MDKQGVMGKLQYVQQHLKAPKGQYNSFGDYRYRSCEDIQEALKPLLGEVGAVLLLSDEIVQIGERYYIKAAAIFQDTESSDSVKNVAYAREADSKPKMDAAQITGSASSYARKYALNGLFCIDDAKDPDAMDNHQEPKGKGQTAAGIQKSSPGGQGKTRDGMSLRVGQNHINTIRAQIARTGAMEKAVCYQYQIKSLKEMTMEQFRDAMEIFRTMPDKEQSMTEEEYQLTLDGIAAYESEMPFR